MTNIPKTIIIAIGENSGKLIPNIVLNNIMDISTINIDSKTKPFIDEKFISQNQDKITSIFSSTDIVFVISYNLNKTSLDILNMATNNNVLAIPILIGTDEHKENYSSYLTLIIDTADNKKLPVLISQAINAITQTIIGNEEIDIILDYSDLKEVMSIPGMAITNTVEYTGKSAGIESMKALINLELSIQNAKGALICFGVNPDFPIAELFGSIEILKNPVNEDTNIIFSTSTDSSLASDYVKTTLILTGL